MAFRCKMTREPLPAQALCGAMSVEAVGEHYRRTCPHSGSPGVLVSETTLASTC